MQNSITAHKCDPNVTLDVILTLEFLVVRLTYLLTTTSILPMP